MIQIINSGMNILDVNQAPFQLFSVLVRQRWKFPKKKCNSKKVQLQSKLKIMQHFRIFNKKCHHYQDKLNSVSGRDSSPCIVPGSFYTKKTSLSAISFFENASTKFFLIRQ